MGKKRSVRTISEPRLPSLLLIITLTSSAQKSPCKRIELIFVKIMLSLYHFSIFKSIVETTGFSKNFYVF
jgi:hypothetical protein